MTIKHCFLPLVVFHCLFSSIQAQTTSSIDVEALNNPGPYLRCYKWNLMSDDTRTVVQYADCQGNPAQFAFDVGLNNWYFNQAGTGKSDFGVNPGFYFEVSRSVGPDLILALTNEARGTGCDLKDIYIGYNFSANGFQQFYDVVNYDQFIIEFDALVHSDDAVSSDCGPSDSSQVQGLVLRFRYMQDANIISTIEARFLGNGQYTSSGVDYGQPTVNYRTTVQGPPVVPGRKTHVSVDLKDLIRQYSSELCVGATGSLPPQIIPLELQIVSSNKGTNTVVELSNINAVLRNIVGGSDATSTSTHQPGITPDYCPFTTGSTLGSSASAATSVSVLSSAIGLGASTAEEVPTGFTGTNPGKEGLAPLSLPSLSLPQLSIPPLSLPPLSLPPLSLPSLSFPAFSPIKVNDAVPPTDTASIIAPAQGADFLKLESTSTLSLLYSATSSTTATSAPLVFSGSIVVQPLSGDNEDSLPLPSILVPIEPSPIIIPDTTPPVASVKYLGSDEGVLSTLQLPAPTSTTLSPEQSLNAIYSNIAAHPSADYTPSNIASYSIATPVPFLATYTSPLPKELSTSSAGASLPVHHTLSFTDAWPSDTPISSLTIVPQSIPSACAVEYSVGQADPNTNTYPVNVRVTNTGYATWHNWSFFFTLPQSDNMTVASLSETSQGVEFVQHGRNVTVEGAFLAAGTASSFHFVAIWEEGGPDGTWTGGNPSHGPFGVDEVECDQVLISAAKRGTDARVRARRHSQEHYPRTSISIYPELYLAPRPHRTWPPMTTYTLVSVADESYHPSVSTAISTTRTFTSRTRSWTSGNPRVPASFPSFAYTGTGSSTTPSSPAASTSKVPDKKASISITISLTPHQSPTPALPSTPTACAVDYSIGSLYTCPPSASSRSDCSSAPTCPVSLRLSNTGFQPWYSWTLTFALSRADNISSASIADYSQVVTFAQEGRNVSIVGAFLAAGKNMTVVFDVDWTAPAGEVPEGPFEVDGVECMVAIGIAKRTVEGRGRHRHGHGHGRGRRFRHKH